MTLERIPEFVADAVGVLPEGRRPADIEQLLCGYLGHLVETNAQINLVSRQNTLTHIERFTRECLFLAKILGDEWATLGRPARVLDIGSGGGFPAMILKIALPDIEMQMVEATRKKARFLAEVAAGLDLRQTSILWGRAEDLADVSKLQYKKELHHYCDAVTGKGLGTLEASTALAAPFLRPGGMHWTFKGAHCREEIEAAGGFFRQRGFAPERVERIPCDAESWIVGIRRLERRN